MTHHPVQWAEPDWSLPVVDFDEQQGTETRRRLGGELVNTKTLVIGTHYPSPTAGYLVDKKGRIIFSVEKGVNVRS